MPKKGYKQPESVRLAKSLSMRGERNSNFGKPLAPETCKKISISRIGKLCGESNPRWNGGRKISDGYVYLLKKVHPNTTKFGYILEHILVMEAHLGRYLTDGETVHHINGNRRDNRIENLRLFPSSAAHVAYHSGEKGDVGWSVYNRNHPKGTRTRTPPAVRAGSRGPSP